MKESCYVYCEHKEEKYFELCWGFFKQPIVLLEVSQIHYQSKLNCEPCFLPKRKVV